MVNVCAIVAPLPEDAPKIPVWITVHENVVPATVLVKVIFVVPEEQIVVSAVLAVATGIGFTLTTTICGTPGQPPTNGVTEYTASPILLLVVVNIWAIIAPLPLLAPVTLVWTTFQLNTVPTTLLVNTIGVTLPEQTDCNTVDAVTTGIGFTVIVIEVAGPWQEPTLAVMV